MADFDITSPTRFVPEGLYIDDGGPHRLAHGDLVFNGLPPKAHESFAIALVELEIPVPQIEQALQETRDYVQNVLVVCVLSFTAHPLGIRIFLFSSTLRRDTIIFRQPYQLDEEHTLRFKA